MSETNQLLDGDLAMIIASYMRRIDAGESVDQQRILMDHPHLKAALESYFADVALIEMLAGPTASDLIAPAGIENESGTAAFGTPLDAIDSERPVNQKRANGDQLVEGQFGRYQIEKILGQGAMGAVYLAHDDELERRVALKVPKIEEEEVNEELMERFYREARAAATLEHAGICRVYDVGSQNGISYIAMAYINGLPLSSLIKQAKIKSNRNIGVVVRKLAMALESAHQKGVIHRDLKPANIMMKDGKEPVIMDFGLARQLHKEETSRLTVEGTVMGTPAYMSPEQVSGDIDSVGSLSDIYSLGVIFYEMLTGGELPFQGPVVVIIAQIIGTEPNPPSSIKEGIDPKLESICLKMMAKRTEDRYQSMQEVVDELTAYLKKNTKSVTDSPERVPKLRKPDKKRKSKQRKQPLTLFEKIKNWSSSTKALVLSACVSALFLAAAITFFFKMGDRTVAVTLNDPTAKVTIDGKHHVEFDGQMGHVDLKIGSHELTVTKGGAVIKVRVIKDGAEITDQGKFAFTVEKESKNLLEIKVLDQLKPPAKVVASPPAKVVTTIQEDLPSKQQAHTLRPHLSEILKQIPVGVQEFDFKRESDRDDYGVRLFQGGRIVIESTTQRKEVRAWPFATGEGSGLVQVDVQTINGSGWGVVFHSDQLNRGFCVALDKKTLEVGPSIWGTETVSPKATLTDKAPTHGVNQFDQLHVLIEGQTVTVFLNGEQCGAPVELDFEFGKYKIAPGIISDINGTKVEFERILTFSLPQKPEPEFQTSHRRLIEILKQKPVKVQEFDFHRDTSEDGPLEYSVHDGRKFVKANPGRIQATWPDAEHVGSGLCQIDVQTVKGCGWMVVFHNDQLDRGFRIEMKEGSLNLGTSIFDPKSLGPAFRTLLAKPPTHGLKQFDRLHVLIERRMVTVFLNGIQCGDPVELDFDLGRHNVCTGALNVSYTSSSEVEYERVLKFSLPENLNQAFKTTDKRLIEILKQKPVRIQEFDFKRKPERRDSFVYEMRDDRMFVESELGFINAAWSWANFSSPGLVQVDVKTMQGSGWVVVFHNNESKLGFRIELKAGKIKLGRSLFSPKTSPLVPRESVLNSDAPTHGLKQFDRLHVLIEGRTITVYLNGKQCGEPVKLKFDLKSYNVCPGAINQSDKTITKVEYERILQFPLVD